MAQYVLVDIDELKKFAAEAVLYAEPVIENEAWFTKEAAKFLRTSPTKVKEMAESGSLPGRLIKGSWRFSSVAVYRWLANQEGEAYDTKK